LNRCFPGDPDGSATLSLAHLLISQFVSKADCIFSLHGWGKEAVVYPYVEYPAGKSETAQIAKIAAMASGFSYLYPYPWPRGVLGHYALDQGIPILEGEIGGMGTITPQGQALYRDAIRNFLAHFQVLKSPPLFTHDIHFIHHQEVRATQAGLFRTSLEIGQPVTKSEFLGAILDRGGAPLESLHAPCTGIVGVKRTLSSVGPGDMLFHLFLEADE
jgi:predicted deacylase